MAGMEQLTNRRQSFVSSRGNTACHHTPHMKKECHVEWRIKNAEGVFEEMVD